MAPRKAALGLVTALALAPQSVAAQGPAPPDPGLVTRQSRHTPGATADRFEAAVRERGWEVFTRVDHAAAAERAGLRLRPRTVVVFGNPRIGTPTMQAHPTLVLDLPLRVLVWEDDQGRVWLTRNSGEYMGEQIYRRHGVAMAAEARQGMEAMLAGLIQRATE